MLALEPNSDWQITPAFDYRKSEVYPAAKNAGFALTPLEGDDARRDLARQHALRPEVGFVTGVGHGRPSAFVGRGDDIYAIGEYHPAEPRGKIIHLLACRTAAERGLGSDMVDKGCRAFFGYDHDFVYPLNKADQFLACDAAIDLALLRRCTAGEAHDLAVARYLKEIALLEALPDPDSVNAGRLATNLLHLRSPRNDPTLGRVDARL